MHRVKKIPEALDGNYNDGDDGDDGDGGDGGDDGDDGDDVDDSDDGDDGERTPYSASLTGSVIARKAQLARMVSITR